MSCPVVEGYDILGKLGSGSYSTVFKAIEKKTKKLVAIKCIKKADMSPKAIDNIITEIRLLKKFKHNHIVEMRDFAWDSSYIYIILEYCAGGNLSTFIKNRVVLPESTCKKFLQQLALALKYLRIQNVVHMDLKPENLLLTMPPQSILKIADFGFATIMPSDTEQTSIRGSPLYMAPEILLKGRYDARADLWAVGVILYECLFGRAPFSSKNLATLFEKIKSGTPVELPPNSKISDECQNLLLGLLKRDPTERITYDAFFAHPFLDLEHAPTTENHAKAIKIVEDAIKEDTKGCSEKAFQLYCDALRYFLPLVSEEENAAAKQEMRTRVKEYINRAEQLKLILLKSTETRRTVPSSSSQPSSSVSTKYHINTATQSFHRLIDLSSTSPSLLSALERGRTGILYEREGSHKSALETLKGALEDLVPLLSKEPPGERRDLLHTKIQDWLKEAETIKLLLSVDKLKESTECPKEQCVVQ